MGWLALRHSVSVCFFASLLSVLTAQAQITNLTNSTSTPIPGAGHDYLGMLNETVNPGNGSVSVRIPIPVPPGRGLSVPLTFAYDSNGVIPPWDNSSPTGWGSNAGCLSQGGWTYTVPLLGVRSGELTKTIGSPPITYHCFYWYDYIFLDTNGTRHPMGMVGLQTPDSCAKLFVPHLDGGDGGFIGNA